MKTELEISKLVEEWLVNNVVTSSSQAPGLLVGFIEGYKSAQSQLYSLDDMRQSWNESGESYSKELSGIFEDSDSPWRPKTFEEFIQSLGK